MKTILLLPMLFFSLSASFAQQPEKKTIRVTTSPNLKKFLDSEANHKPGILLKPHTVKEYPQQITLLDSLGKGLVRKELIKEFNPVMTNSIPVWSPGKDYVFNMPGTFAFDKNQVRIHTPRFITVVNHKKGDAVEKKIPTKE